MRVSKVTSSGHPETPKKVYKESESVNVCCCRLCKSVGGNLGKIFTAKSVSTTSGGGRGASDDDALLASWGVKRRDPGNEVAFDDGDFGAHVKIRGVTLGR